MGAEGYKDVWPAEGRILGRRRGGCAAVEGMCVEGVQFAVADPAHAVRRCGGL